MKELGAYGQTLPEAYHETLIALERWGDIVPCPDYNTSQKEVSMTMVVEEPLAEPMIPPLPWARWPSRSRRSTASRTSP